MPLPDDSPAVAARRVRTGAPQAKSLCKQRPASAEWVNVQARNCGLRQFTVRRPAKVGTIARWRALAHDLPVQARLSVAA